MNPNQDESRCYDGFSTLDGGLDFGRDPSMIGNNQFSFGVNVSIRGGNVSTRNGMNQRMLMFDSESTRTNYFGSFQGAMGFSSKLEDSNSILISISGRLFRIWIDRHFLVTEITPKLLVSTISDIVLPAPGGSITVNVNDTSQFTVGETVIIGPSTFTITAIGIDQLTLTYVSGFQVGNVQAAVDSLIPAHAINYSLSLNSVGPLVANQVIIISGIHFVAVSVGSGVIVIDYTPSSNVVIPDTTPIKDTGGTTITTVSGAVTYLAGALSLTLTPATVVGLSVNQVVTMSGLYYVITHVGATTINVTYTSNANLTIPGGTGVQDSGGSQITYTLDIPPSSPVEDSLGNQIFAIQTNNQNADYVDMFQGDDYSLFITPGQKTLFFDGSTVSISDITASQIPSGSIGTFAWGRNWVAQVDRQTFIASDLTGDPSGSPALLYKDAVLFVTENNILNGGGAFSIPAQSGKITAMTSLSELDTSLGIGPVLVGTSQRVYSVQAPVDRTTWQNLSYPIQSVAIDGSGPVGPDNHCKTNSDWWFRSLDGYRSFIAARQDFGYTDGKTPQSFEVSPILEKDNQKFLFFGSMINFGNRIYGTVSPFLTKYGVAHSGFISLNLDPVSTMSQKGKPAWESLNTGLNVLRLVSVNDNGTIRGFALALNGSNGIDLWELSDSDLDTDDVLVSGSSFSNMGYIQIQSVIETRSMTFGDETTQKKGITSELYLDQISDQVTVKLYLRPDQYPGWVLWDTQTICSNNKQCVFPTDCSIFQESSQQYAARIMFKRPPETPNPISGKPMDRFYKLQCRMEITGSCEVQMFKVHAKWERQKMEGEAPKNSGCTTVAICEKPWYSYSSYGP